MNRTLPTGTPSYARTGSFLPEVGWKLEVTSLCPALEKAHFDRRSFPVGLGLWRRLADSAEAAMKPGENVWEGK